MQGQTALSASLRTRPGVIGGRAQRQHQHQLSFASQLPFASRDRPCTTSGRSAGHAPRRASTAEQSTATTSGAADNDAFMEEMMEFLREDQQHLFDDQGIDASKFDDRVEFLDPITKYNSLSGYLFNIKMLRYVFDPDYVCHDLRRTGPWEVTTRWSMAMKFTPITKSPLSRWWSPELMFTGVSILGINPATRRFNRHIDLWDALENNDYFSWEGASHVAAQLGSHFRTPQLETPTYRVLRKTKKYEIRAYDAFLVAEAPMTLPSTNNKQGRGVGAFQTLANFIFGGNEGGVKMAMTTPVITTDKGAMRFMLPTTYKDVDSVPAPQREGVSVARVEPQLLAATTFNGVADEAQVQAQMAQLREQLVADGYEVGDESWVARYNDPSTKPFFRRNEVLLPVHNFDLWEGPTTRKS